MIVETTDPLGTEYACVRPGGSNFTYDSEESFENGWAISLWFEYNSWSSLKDRLVTFEDLVDADNDIRIELWDDGGTRKVAVAGIDVTNPILLGDGWKLLVVTSVPNTNNIFISIGTEAEGGSEHTITQYPVNPRIQIGKAPDRDFRGNIFDVRIYNKAISPKSASVLYNDAINNQGRNTVPL